MENTISKATALVGLTLLFSVVTQIIYITALEDVGLVEGWPMRSTLWTIEFLAFTVMAVAALTALVRDTKLAIVWAALALSALFNIIQTGMGLSMFLPAAQAGEDFAPMLGTIVAGAFVFYLLAKLLIGLAAIGLGVALYQRGGGLAKAIGALSILAGLGAAATNLIAIPQGMAMIFPAGAAGTVGAVFAGLAALLIARSPRIASAE